MKTKILIVDDLRENILALSRLIENDDVELLSALGPDEALNLVLDHEFGLALLDVQMPVMSGFELARLIRGIEKGRHLPIIFVTAQASESTLIFEGYESGAVDVLFKPLDPHIVRNKVNVFVQLDRQSRLLQEQVVTMAKLKADAEAANVAKSRFLANMSHEIRTPLSAVLGFADILSTGELQTHERSEYLSSISRNGKLLLRIIDDILDISRVEAQRIQLESTEVDLTEILRDMETTLAKKASDKGIDLRFTRKEGLVRKVVSDPLRMKQILLNVIGNAIKFTESGTVAIEVESRLVDADSVNGRAHEVTFTIEDTGIGLTPDEAERIFAPFAQADSSTRRKYGGTGLGLAISKHLSRSMGGDLRLIRSEKGKGSVFVLSMRLDEATPAADQKSTETLEADSKAAGLTPVGTSEPRETIKHALDGSLRGRKILVVDDVADNRILIERYLRPSGAQVQLASGGQEALEIASGGDEWDVVLMDIQMPNMDGYEATQRLRRQGFHKPIIAVTAHAMKDELEKCMRAGCDRTMTKPVTKKALIDTLSTILA